MGLTQIQKIQVNKQVDHILHTPGNQPVTMQGRQSQLEMAFVIDCSCEQSFLQSTLSDTVASLKQHDKIFQNVRSNVIFWRGKNEKLVTEVMPMSFIQMGKPFTHPAFTPVDNTPVFDELCAYLKVFHARSKAILIFTQGRYEVVEPKKVYEALNPFLKTKILCMTPEKMITGAMINMEMMHKA